MKDLGWYCADHDAVHLGDCPAWAPALQERARRLARVRNRLERAATELLGRRGGTA